MEAGRGAAPAGLLRKRTLGPHRGSPRATTSPRQELADDLASHWPTSGERGKANRKRGPVPGKTPLLARRKAPAVSSDGHGTITGLRLSARHPLTP